MKRRSALDVPERDKPRDLGWKARAVCADGPLVGVGVGRKIEDGAEVRIEDQKKGKLARYLNVGPGHGIPPADGVALKFIGYVEGE